MAVTRRQQPDDADASERVSNHIEARLLQLLNTVNEWLRFAESKNSHLLLFCGAVIAAISTVLAGSTTFSPDWRTGLLISMAFLCVSCPVSLVSFFPRTNLKKILAARKGVPCEEDNLYFYGDLCKYTPEELVTAIARSHMQESSFQPSKFHLDLAAQVVVNSHIAVHKYKLFKVSLIIAMLSIGAPAGLIIKSIFR